MRNTTAAEFLSRGEKFSAMHTGARGVVMDRTDVVDHDGAVRRSARVKLVGPYGVKDRTLHPDVIVERDS
jgi:hypothetical protein